jgi:hypothetical protein
MDTPKTGNGLCVLEEQRPLHSHQACRHGVVRRVLGAHVELKRERQLSTGYRRANTGRVHEIQIGVG